MYLEKPVLVSDLLPWIDHPYRCRVPKTIEVRRGMNCGEDTVCFWNSKNQTHVDLAFESAKKLTRDQMKHILHLLGS